jgi:uncharacterized protein YacL
MLSLITAVVWVDFITIALSRFRNLGKSLDHWYERFGPVAVLNDCLVILLGILIAQWLFPRGDIMTIVIASVVIQLIHDGLFYLFVIQPIPQGHNRMMDLFKEYANENGWKILLADSIMIGSTVVLASYIQTLSQKIQIFKLLLGIYALTYVIYTRPA